MKKKSILFSAVFLVLLMVTLFFLTDLYQSGSETELEQKVIKGQPETGAAYRLKADFVLRTGVNKGKVWNGEAYPGKEFKYKTERQKGKVKTSEEKDETVIRTLFIQALDRIDSDHNIEADWYRPEYSKAQKALQDFAESEDLTAEYRLCDLIDKVPVGSGSNIYGKEGEFFTIDEVYSETTSQYENEADHFFRENFSIPVPETLTVTLTKEENGLFIEPGQGDTIPGFSVESDALYFTFSSYDSNCRPLDLSQLTWGYGIYKVPYDKKTGYPVFKKTEKLCSLDENISINNLGSYDEETLRLVYGNDTGTYVRFINCKTGKTVNEVKAAEFRSYAEPEVLQDENNNLLIGTLINDEAESFYVYLETAGKMEYRKGLLFPEEDCYIQVKDFLYDEGKLVLAGKDAGRLSLLISGRDKVLFFGNYYPQINSYYESEEMYPEKIRVEKR